jgi:hypothetical protein
METLSRPSSPALSVSQHSQKLLEASPFLGQLLNLSPWPKYRRGHVSPLSHIFRDEDTVVELALKADLPQKGLRLHKRLNHDG